MGWSEKSETARRIAAARVLRGWDQVELDRRLSEAEAGEDLGGRLERDETSFQRPRRAAVAQVLGVPEEWFTEPLDALLARAGDRGRQEPALEERLDAIEGSLAALWERLEALLQNAVEQALEETERRRREDDGNGAASAAS